MRRGSDRVSFTVLHIEALGDTIMSKRLAAICTLMLASTVWAGCASSGTSSGSGSASLLSAEQLMETNERNLYMAIQRLRPQWLRPRGSQISGGEVALFVDGAPRGSVSQLNSIPIDGIVEVQYYGVTEAGFTFGTAGGSAGVIEVRTLR